MQAAARPSEGWAQPISEDTYESNDLTFIGDNMTTYYIKNGGNDGNTGFSDAQAWETIAKINDFAESTGFSDGDIIQLKRGSTWSSDEPIGYGGAGISWGTINGLTFQDYGTGNLPRLDCNTQQAIFISSSTISNLTIKNIDVSGMDWTYGNHKTDGNIRIHAVNGVIIDGIYCDGHIGTSVYRRHGSAISVTRTDGDIEIKNCTIKNRYKDTFANSLSAWGSEDVQGIIIWYNNNDAPKLSGTVSIHDNTIRNIYADCIQTGGIQTTMNIYNNTFSNFGENCTDLKKSRYVTIYDNEMSHNDFGQAGGCSKHTGPAFINAGAASSTWIGYKNQDITIRDNYFHDCDTLGLDVVGDNWKIYRNYFKDVGLPIRMISFNGTEVYNNVFELNSNTDNRYVIYQKAAISCNIYDRTHCLIYNNTIYISASNYLYGIAWMGSAGDSGNVIRNNIIYMMENSATVHPLYIGDHDGSNTFPNVDHNCCYNPNHTNRVSWGGTLYDSTEQAAWRTAGHTGALFENPVFVNANDGDLALQSSSPAINKGADLGSPYNLGLNPTSAWPHSVKTLNQYDYGTGWEIGAYVYGAVEAPAKGIIVNLDYPAEAKHGETVDINAATENIGGLPGMYKMQIWRDGVLVATSILFTLSGGETSIDRIDPFAAPASGEAMTIDIKCIRITL